MKLSEIIHPVRTLAVEGSLDRDITGITCDSRCVRPGNLFVAVRGARTDGHQYVEAAIDRGAAAVVMEDDGVFDLHVTRIRVADARHVMALASAQFYHHPSQHLQVVGITGTNGKTTTAFMVKAILEAAGVSTGLLGTVQYVIGKRVIPAMRTTPESVEIQMMMSQMLQAGCGAVSMEVSSHALDQHRVDGVDFDVAVFTNLTQDHLDYHGTMENYFDAKARLFTTLGMIEKKGRAVINVDDPYGRRLLALLGRTDRVLSYGMATDAVVRAKDVRISADGSYFVVCTPLGEMALSFPMIGRHNISNALAAIATGVALGMDLAVIERSLTHLPSVPGRLERVNVGEGFHVFVDYAHTEDALRNVLTTVSDLTKGRLIVVFGCGGNRDKGKRQPMGEAACEWADFSILTSDNPRREEPQAILAEIAEGFGANGQRRYQIVEDRREAIERALDIAREGDTVLIAGKGHETYQEFADTVVPFNDREVVERYFEQFGFRWKRCA